jgi:hypothetical protein
MMKLRNHDDKIDRRKSGDFNAHHHANDANKKVNKSGMFRKIIHQNFQRIFTRNKGFVQINHKAIDHIFNLQPDAIKWNDIRKEILSSNRSINSGKKNQFQLIKLSQFRSF